MVTVTANKQAFQWKKMFIPAIVMLTFLTLGTVNWQSTGVIMGLLFFGTIGVSASV